MIPRLLEIGAQKYPRSLEYEQFDMHDWGLEQFGFICHYGDARKLPFEDKSFDEVYSSQTLEHFGRLETVDVIREWWRIIKVGGYLVLDLPDIVGMLQDYTSGENSWDLFVERLYGTQDYEGNTHYTMFTIKEFPNLVDSSFGAAGEITTIYPQHNDGGFHVEILKKHVCG